MKLKQWLIGTAGALALGLMAMPAQAAPLSGAANGANAAAGGNSAVQNVFWWGYPDRPNYYRPYYYRGYSPNYYRGYDPYYSYAYGGGYYPYYYNPGYLYYAPRHRHFRHRRW